MSDKCELCANCPKREVKKGWFSKIFPKSYNDKSCNGPESINVSGKNDTDYKNYSLTTSIVRLTLCGKEVTPEMREASNFIQQSVEMSQAKRQAELDETWASMSEAERQAILDGPINIEP